MRLWHGTGPEMQRGDELSHVGGIPLLPIGGRIPVCPVTGTEMTFFFQLHVRREERSGGLVVSLFAVTDHAEDAAYLPALPAELRGAALDAGFFADEPKFYRGLCFNPARAARGSPRREAVAFRSLRVDDMPERGWVAFGRMGGCPDWLLEDEAPLTFEGRASGVEFLFQTELDYAFATAADAPRQRILAGNGSADSLSSDHDLFVGNALYVFALSDRGTTHIYVVPQS